MEKKGKFLKEEPPKSKKPKKSVNPMKATAIVLSSLAVVLVLAAVGVGTFVWYSGNVRGSMFAARSSVSDTIPQDTTSAADATETQAHIEADWIDDQGNAYNYRDDVISILLMGIDYMGDERHWRNATESNGGNADVIGLVILNTRTFDFSILYIPRDTMADVIAMDADGQYLDTVYTNISTSHSYGDGKDLSCRLTTDAVSRLLYGVPVGRYVALDYDALYTLNDLIGGLTITFDDDYTDIDSSFTRGNTVTLNRWYMRRFITYRSKTDVEGAYKRGVRSMAVMKALFNQCKEKIVADPTVALEYYNGLKGYITTDLDMTEITYLARNMGKMHFTSDTVVRLPGETVMGERYAEFYPDETWLHDFVVEKFCVPAE